MKDQIKRVITDFTQKKISNIIPRDYGIPLESNKIISLVGTRRSGKTSILMGIIAQLREKYSADNCIYINFEDDRLFPLELKSLDVVIEGYYELFPEKRNEKVFLFLDEVQVVENWELFVRRIYDTLQVQIYITGSSSKLLTTDISTSLRGRTITFEIFPFSFKEYLDYQKIEVNLYSSSSLSFINNELEKYCVDGGFAETIGETSFISRKILSDYLDLIVYKDIVERYNISNRSFLKTLIKYCFTNVATLLSYNKLYNEFKSAGYKLGKDTLIEYIDHLEDVFALFTVPIYRNNVKEEIRNPRKIYSIDAGFKKIFDYAIGDDMSKLYENIVFLDLRRRTKEIYYYKISHEVDFYCKLQDKDILVNVCYEMKNPDTRKREYDSLVEGMEYFNLHESWLITHSEEAVVEIDAKKINIVPLFKWLLR